MFAFLIAAILLSKDSKVIEALNSAVAVVFIFLIITLLVSFVLLFTIVSYSEVKGTIAFFKKTKGVQQIY